MTFGQEYLTHLRVIQNIGMARIDPIIYNGVEVVPIQFLKAVLPDPKSLGANYHGQTSIGCRIRGIKDGKERTYYIYNNCDHEQAYRETGTQAVSFTTGVPAALGASMWAKGLWRGAGVFNVEEFDPDPFLAGFRDTNCSTWTSSSDAQGGKFPKRGSVHGRSPFSGLIMPYFRSQRETCTLYCIIYDTFLLYLGVN